jgi:hypothetical protein
MALPAVFIDVRKSGAFMQTTIVEPTPALPFLASAAEFEFVEPKRIVLTPLEMCLLSDSDDLFDDED